MKILVSGGTGFVGRYVVEGLLDAGHQVVVAARHPVAEQMFSRPVGHVRFSLDPDADQSHVFDDAYHFVHAAFDHLPGRYRGGEGDDPQGFRRRNLDGSVRLFEAARRAGVRRCVFLSSRAVYDGLAAGSALTEDMPLSPSSLYGEVKLRAEQVLADLSGPGFAGISLRATGVYGDLRPNKWDGLFADYLAGRPVESRAGSEVHGRDLAEAVRLVLEADTTKVSGKAFNLSDIVTDTREILSLLRQATGADHPPPEPADRTAVAEMATKRIRALGWKPGGRTLLEETVRRLAGAL
ncbi:NAD(P)-dependent oxidoreductase [Pseudomonas sp. R2.Fl]|nr:NAD(P)-dependent oxidoreductase [Pseudomonas sp. R2.Fl]